MEQTVLLVDDDQQITSGLRRRLHDEPIRVLAASSAEEALEILAVENVDVVVSDEKMSGMSGTEFLCRVSKEYPNTVRMILTGFATIDIAIRAINDGSIFRFLRKPCDRVELSCAIQDALRHKELLSATNRLLQSYKAQGETLRDLETAYPGITEVTRDTSGAVILGEGSTDIDELSRKIQEVLDPENGGQHGPEDALGPETA